MQHLLSLNPRPPQPNSQIPCLTAYMSTFPAKLPWTLWSSCSSHSVLQVFLPILLPVPTPTMNPIHELPIKSAIEENFPNRFSREGSTSSHSGSSTRLIGVTLLMRRITFPVLSCRLI